jgi:hypothetical protein
MRNLANRMGMWCIVLCMFPTAFFANVIGKAMHIDSFTITCIQIPGLLIQFFFGFLLIKYRQEVFNK